ncbi:late control protein [Chryseobacterium salviniae]|uniref:Late control protein n=1 Tax=Chryseobacterium salviniae TaxID=3101750 RepID=A0ABU6HVG9_9FLAO|nr:late control protein [Chryseobacterium sp. T9W2-O]MEC3875932.1 late control protein [Chryseobacterium sp. T9W2-O]
MFILKSEIKIGDYTFRSITNVEITKSVEDLVDTAVITMPAKFKVKQNGEEKYTEDAVKVGDKVVIKLAYEGKYEGVEFTGFVNSIGSKIPLEIKCEDSMWLLRRKNINKAFNKKTELKTILQEVVSGTELKLSDKIPGFEIDKFIIQNANGTQVLQKLKEEYGLSIYLDDEGKLYAGLQQLNNVLQNVIYDLNYNIVENNLEYKSAEQKRIKVKYSCRDKKNKQIKVEIGDDDGEVRSMEIKDVFNEKELRKMAEAALKSAKYDGFEGSVKSFLIPYATRGMAAVIQDKKHKNREGKYFIKKVVTTFGTDGARRDVTISNKL